MKLKRFLFILILTTLIPFSSFAQGYAATDSILNPDTWFKTMRENITIPIPMSSGTQVKLPTPENALKQAAPKLQIINKKISEETGIDLAKFIGWFAKILRAVFMIIFNLLETVAKSLKQQ